MLTETLLELGKFLIRKRFDRCGVETLLAAGK